MTAQVWIDQTRNMLLSSYVEELRVLETAVTASATETTLIVTSAASSGIVPGVIIEINLELFYVTATSGTEISVIRGYAGSPIEAHAVLDIVRISPKFPAFRILEALNDDLADLSAPDNGLFQMKFTSFQYVAPVDGYNMVDSDGVDLTSEDVLAIYSVSYADIGVANMQPDIQSWSLKRTRDVKTFTSGLALILYSGAAPGRTVTVNYKAPLKQLTLSDARATSGLATTAYDLPPLGAALNLMSTTPIRREFLDAQGSSRRSEEVPPGAISASMRDLRARRSRRIESEASRIVAMYPQMWGRNSAVQNNYWNYAGPLR